MKQSAGPRWKPSDCSHCLIPDILWANASEYLALHAEIKLGVLGIGRRIAVTAWCTKHDREIADPYVGCTLCVQERPDIANWTETDA